VLHSVNEGYSVSIYSRLLIKYLIRNYWRTLVKHDITGKLYSVIGNRLSNKKQRVCIKGKCSNWMLVWSGVPQGSVLAPVVCLIFINDVDKDISSNIPKFIDDTTIFKKVKNSPDCSQLEADLNKFLLLAQK